VKISKTHHKTKNGIIKKNPTISAKLVIMELQSRGLVSNYTLRKVREWCKTDKDVLEEIINAGHVDERIVNRLKMRKISNIKKLVKKRK
jgi:hypothetical protein